MKWLIGVFAALMIFGSAEAKEINVAFQAKQYECRWYQGSFGPNGARAPMTDNLPKIACKVTDGVGVRCVLREHGLEQKLPTLIAFRGNFQDYGDGIDFGPDGYALREETGEPLAFQLKCHENSGCIMRLWNTNADIGYSCNLMKWTPQPAPKPPELLRNPERKDAPPPYKTPEVESFKL
jgi:hypothetical protein